MLRTRRELDMCAKQGKDVLFGSTHFVSSLSTYADDVRTVTHCTELNIRCHNGFCFDNIFDNKGNSIRNRLLFVRPRNEDEFLCNNESIDASASWRCDEKSNCINNTDEKCGSTLCGSNPFYCRSRKCIDRNYLCDGFNDCKDGYDENQCGRPVNSNGENSLKGTYGAYINMPLNITFEVEGSPNAHITGVVVISEDRHHSYLQINRHWIQTRLKSTYTSSTYVTKLTLNIHNITTDIIDREYLLNVSNENGITTFPFLLRKIDSPRDTESTIPVKYIQFDANKNSTLELNLTIKGYPEPYISEIMGIDVKGAIHSLFPEWKYTADKSYQQPFTTTFTLQSQYHAGDVVYQKYFTIIKNSQGTITIQFQFISQGDTSQNNDKKGIALSTTLMLAVFVGICIIGVLKKKGIIKSLRLPRGYSVTSSMTGILTAEVSYSAQYNDNGSDIYHEVLDECEEIGHRPGDHVKHSISEQVQLLPLGQDDVKIVGRESSSSSESVLSFLIQIHNAHNASPTVDTELSYVSLSDPNYIPQCNSAPLSNVTLGSLNTEQLQSIHIQCTSVDSESPNSDQDSDYDKPDEEGIVSFSWSSLHHRE